MRIVFLSSVLLFGAPLCAQSLPLIASGATIAAPLTVPVAKARLQVRLGEASGPILDDERGKISGNSVTARLEAEPGRYVLQAVSDDSNRTPLGDALRVQIPGLKRENGRWLFNGSLFCEAGENRGLAIASPFIAGLRRNKKAKLPLIVSASAPLKWSLLEVGASDELAARIQSARAAGTQFVGVRYPIPFLTNEKPTPFNAANEIARFKAFRDALDALAPEAALVVKVRADAEPARAAAALDALAPLADAVEIEKSATTTPNSSEAFEWLLKVARRGGEEQPNFDLPIFVSSSSPLSESQTLAFWADGATGFIEPAGAVDGAATVLDRNVALWSSAVTLEDAAIAPAGDARAPLWSAFLRSAGRIPLLGHLPDEDDKKTAESLFTALDDNTSTAKIEAIFNAATRGATLYVEGAPALALWKRWSEISGVTLESITPQREELTLDDLWFWGEQSGTSFTVSQSVRVKVKPSLAAQAREERGQAVETQPRALARLAGAPNGVILCPVGKGRLIWAPHAFSDPGARGLSGFYAAIAGTLGASMVSTSATAGDATTVSVRMRATASADADKIGPASLILFTNQGSAPVSLRVQARGGGAWVSDLASEKTLPSDVRGFASRFVLDIPANGWRLVAIASTPEAWKALRKKSGWRAQLK